MRIQILSDVHIEHHADKGKSFVKSLDPEGVDVLILAGDMVTLHTMDALDQICERYPKVIWVHGNHTFYGSERQWIIDASLQAQDRNSNLIWLDDDTYEYNGYKFLGTPLWFPSSTETALLQRSWPEFERIPQWYIWVYFQNYEACQFLKKNLKEDDIVITHYLPSWRSVDDKYRSQATNCFFVAEQEKLIAERKPKLWIHGHTHGSKDYMFCDTRIVCNPMGYPSDLNRNFANKFLIELEEKMPADT